MIIEGCMQRFRGVLVRHSRKDAFEGALQLATASGRANSWQDISPDPNAAAALAARANTLRESWREPIDNRVDFIVRRCRGQNVIDIGCVAHDVARLGASGWLHGELVHAADRCIGVDILEDGIKEMQALGYNCVCHDLNEGFEPLRSAGPYDVMVAGEVIEHLGSVDLLFEAAAELLTPAGELIISTPNPYAPARVRAGQRGLVWENVDHVVYAFPSGVAELGERHGLVLAEAATTCERRLAIAERWAKAKRRLRGTGYLAVGYRTIGARGSSRVAPGVGFRLLRPLSTQSPRFLGETFVYVLRRPQPRG